MIAGVRKQIDARERHDGPRPAVLEDREIILCQVEDGLSIAVQGGHVDLHELGAPHERRLLGDVRRVPDQSDEQDQTRTTIADRPDRRLLEFSRS